MQWILWIHQLPQDLQNPWRLAPSFRRPILRLRKIGKSRKVYRVWADKWFKLLSCFIFCVTNVWKARFQISTWETTWQFCHKARSLLGPIPPTGCSAAVLELYRAPQPCKTHNLPSFVVGLREIDFYSGETFDVEPQSGNPQQEAHDSSTKTGDRWGFRRNGKCSRRVTEKLLLNNRLCGTRHSDISNFDLSLVKYSTIFMVWYGSLNCSIKKKCLIKCRRNHSSQTFSFPRCAYQFNIRRKLSHKGAVRSWFLGRFIGFLAVFSGRNGIKLLPQCSAPYFFCSKQSLILISW